MPLPTVLYLVPRLRMLGVLPQCPILFAQVHGNLTLFIYIFTFVIIARSEIMKRLTV
jgi:hypothetical protein